MGIKKAIKCDLMAKQILDVPANEYWMKDG